MTWRLARALETLRSQVNAKWPNRSRDSDGAIGDEHHSARMSDHNPNAAGVVCAIDLTHDPRGGFDSYAFADMLLQKRDTRIKYIISNGRIGSGHTGPAAWTWRKYTGINPHNHHCHISVLSDKGHYDAPREWVLGGFVEPTEEVKAAYVAPPATLRKGDRSTQVQTLQGRLNAHGAALTVDGYFGEATRAAVVNFQSANHLTIDGIAGPMVWHALA